MTQLSIRDKLWRLIKMQYPHQQWGECDIDNNTIAIHEDVVGQSELGTLLHEVRHATHPHEDEKEVEAFSRFYTELLWGYGYRKCQSTNTDDPTTES